MSDSDGASSRASQRDGAESVKEEDTEIETSATRTERYGKLFTDKDDFVNLIQQRIVLMHEVPLERATKATTICFRQNLVHRIAPIPEFFKTQLVELDLYDNKIKRIRNVEGFTELRTLDLSFNNIRTIENLEALPALEILYLVQNKITEIGEGLKALAPTLTSLELGANRIRDVGDSLACLTKLECLWLGKNKLTTEGISGPKLSSLVNLRKLSFQSNRLTAIPANVFTCMPHLEELYLSENGITTMENIGCLPSLKILDVARNRITDIADIDKLPELEEFWANDNLIASWRNVATLACCKNLTGITLNRNPVESDQRYRARLKEILPTLLEIDTLPVGRTLPTPPLYGPALGGRRLADPPKPTVAEGTTDADAKPAAADAAAAPAAAADTKAEAAATVDIAAKAEAGANPETANPAPVPAADTETSQAVAEAAPAAAAAAAPAIAPAAEHAVTAAAPAAAAADAADAGAHSDCSSAVPAPSAQLELCD